ncbi:hypothetical protein AURDEDRAFT_169264 [Auricularia subglabra TFB-10046 SS5]|nr:hypothetical protein AURDEDRAFT_169264 [Auricularia subglabra TFB-10046 SS5]
MSDHSRTPSSSSTADNSPPPTASETLAAATRELAGALPAYAPLAVRVLAPHDVREAGAPERALVGTARHKPGPASRAAAFVERLRPLVVAALDADEDAESDVMTAEPVVAALNALALIYTITTRQDDALEQLEKIAYQASRAAVHPELQDACASLLAAVLVFLRGALRKPGVSARRLPVGGAQMYAAGKTRLNGAIALYDAALHRVEADDE